MSGRFKQRLKRLAKAHGIGQLMPAWVAETGEENAIAQLLASLNYELLPPPLTDLQLVEVQRSNLSPQRLLQTLGLSQGVEQEKRDRLSVLPLPGLSAGLRPWRGWLAGLARRWERMALHHACQITGFASDLETRKLVLILDRTIVWDGLCDAQQQKMNRKIAALMVEGVALQRAANASQEDGDSHVEGSLQSLDVRHAQYEISRHEISQSEISVSDERNAKKYGVSQGFPLSGGLAQLVRSFWVDVLWAVVRLRRRKPWRLSASQWRLSGGNKWLRGLQGPWRELFGTRKIMLSLNHSLQSRSLDGKKQMPLLNTASAVEHDSIEADVISAIYVEHPLERILNWVDKILFWLEQQWQALLKRLQQMRRG